jgi:hypothetical protein
MTLPVPDFIRAADIADRDLVFAWDEWDLLAYYDHDEHDVYERLSALSGRAELALTIASGEWVRHRFSLVDSDPAPLQMLEAAWAGVVSPEYIEMPEPEEEQWRGPARGPLYVLMLIVTDAFNHLEEDPDGASRAVWMHNLAKHVLPRADAYDAWFAEVVRRLEQHHPRNENEDDDLFSGLPPGMGAPVAREAFDPSLPYDPKADGARIDAFLRRLDWEANPYLRSPDAISEAGNFEGTPYQYP